MACSLRTEDTKYISWLDKQAPNFVIYVHIGSVSVICASINEGEFVEIAWRLANGEQPILWVVQPGLPPGTEWISPARILELLQLELKDFPFNEAPSSIHFRSTFGNLSGILKEEIKVKIENDEVLQISKERNVEKEDKNEMWHRVERISKKFMRRV
ncbi:unnamed protein product [Ilex paraguariensis]|uniref:SHSP domain-containing protein n=1 Tax=Ilex paraguariensis TaxID=185542 RepID=A0ABC8SPI0_9AQUA